MGDFNCTKCGSCCRLLTDEVLEQFNLPKAESGGCAHLNSKNECLIYETRPNACDVRKMWELSHHEIFTWDEYKKVSEEACKILQEVENGSL